DLLNQWRPDAVIHLAGENIAAGRWSKGRKQRILDSRVTGTKGLATALLKLHPPPRHFVSASAIGFYGSRGDEVLTEGASPGMARDFLAHVTGEWEKASAPLQHAGVRVVHLRFGMILSRKGGALKKMLPFFKLGLGGRLGAGNQWVSWIALADVIGVIAWILADSKIDSPINVVSPYPVTNREFTRELASALHRPSLFPLPTRVLRLVFGEMAEALLLASQRAIPERLLAGGFAFQFPTLPEALQSELKM
ncbi:MAG TPA: TIGR01777 family oxidoreductase, partial [Verrucomicrobiae bacterium]|nr:TIGR01777 family oxidoreductase [Verrucomicrobiae bacterium]